MAATDLQAGLAIFEIGGKSLQVDGSFSINPSTQSREAKTSLQGQTFTLKKRKPATFKATVIVTGEVTPEFIASLDGVEAFVQLEGGRKYSLAGVTTNGEFEHDLANGTMDLEGWCTIVDSEDA